MATFEVMAHHEAGRFELGQYAIDRGKADVVSTALLQQQVEIIRAQVTIFDRSLFQQLQHLHARARHFQAGIAQLVFLVTGVAHASRLRRFWEGFPVPCLTVNRHVYRNRHDRGKAPAMQKRLIYTLLLTGLLTLAGCSSFSFPGVYKLDIQQGNLVTQDMVNQLQPGMTAAQVRYVLGTPLLVDTFTQNRWEYLYSLQPGGDKRTQERLTVYFDQNGRLTHFSGNFVPQASPETMAE